MQSDENLLMRRKKAMKVKTHLINFFLLMNVSKLFDEFFRSIEIIASIENLNRQFSLNVHDCLIFTITPSSNHIN